MISHDHMFKPILHFLVSWLFCSSVVLLSIFGLTACFFTLLCSFVAFRRPQGMGSHSVLEDENHAEENVYIMN